MKWATESLQYSLVWTDWRSSCPHCLLGSRICPPCALKHVSGDRVGSEQMGKICVLPLSRYGNTPKGGILKHHLVSPADQKRSQLTFDCCSQHKGKALFAANGTLCAVHLWELQGAGLVTGEIINYGHFYWLILQELYPHYNLFLARALFLLLFLRNRFPSCITLSVSGQHHCTPKNSL